MVDVVAERTEPASKYWSFRLALQHGFIDTTYPDDACMHPPASDWRRPGVPSAADFFTSAVASRAAAGREPVTTCPGCGGAVSQTTTENSEASGLEDSLGHEAAQPSSDSNQSSSPSGITVAFLVVLALIAASVITSTTSRVIRFAKESDSDAGEGNLDVAPDPFSDAEGACSWSRVFWR